MSSQRECRRQEFCSECVYNCIYELGGLEHQAELSESIADGRGDDEFVEPIEAFDRPTVEDGDLPADDDGVEPPHYEDN